MRKFIVLLLFLVVTNDSSPEVIVNKSVDINKLSTYELREVFLLRKSYWDNGIKIKVFVLPRDSFITRNFAVKYLKMPNDLFYEMLLTSPRFDLDMIVPNESSMILNVERNEGAIGYIYDSKILDGYDSQITIIRIVD